MASKAARFLKLAKPNDKGFSERVSIEVLEDAGLGFGNGGDWCRSSSSLAQTYNVHRVKKGGRIIGVELHGYNKNPHVDVIRADIKNEIKKQRCVILGTSNPEVDHKDGRKDDPRLNDIKTQKLNDFQPLSKAANNAKRQHCKDCRNTGNRFDARRLGYTISQSEGNGIYRGTCVGCFWYDPVSFRKSLSSESNG